MDDARDARGSAGRVVTGHVREPFAVVVAPDDPFYVVVHARSGGRFVERLPAQLVVSILVNGPVLVGHLNPLALTVVFVGDDPVAPAIIGVSYLGQQVVAGDFRIGGRHAVGVFRHLVARRGVDRGERGHLAVGRVGRVDLLGRRGVGVLDEDGHRLFHK